MALHETYMNCGSHDAADTSRSTSSIDRLAARSVQHLVASGQLREDTAVLPSSSSQPFILSGSHTECLEFPIRSLDEDSYVTPHRQRSTPSTSPRPFSLSSAGSLVLPQLPPLGWSLYAGRATYRRDFASIMKSIIPERVFDVPSRFAAVYPSGLSGFWVRTGF